MTTTIELRVEPSEAYNETNLQRRVARQLGVEPERINTMFITRRSVDARQRRVMVNLAVRVAVDEPNAILQPETVKISYRDVRTARHQAIIAGAGPAGLFAALRLIELGIKPIVLERGKDVESRLRDVAAITRNQRIDPESNYCFGEGGAGAFSDGKLYTRSKKRGSVERILSIFHNHGAPADILVDAHPHIGTDKLPRVIADMRHTILAHGGEVRFGTKLTGLITREVNGAVTVVGADAMTADGTSCEFSGPVILATGHSARDVYRMLSRTNATLEPKGIAVGVRLEHPQQLIDSLRYHSPKGRGPWLPPAEYTMLTRIDGRAVYSFCMCPGGFIIPAATDEDQIVVNGMSPANRGGRWANSGMVVEVLPDDVEGDEPLKMMHYQEAIERRFYDDAPEGGQNAPAQRMTDFVAGRKSSSLPRSSYAPGLHSARVDLLLPEGVAGRLQKGFVEFDKKNRGFLTSEATVVGDETRTSSPVRVSRDSDSLQACGLPGLFPCGEGAGYAGGIVSAAIDGERCADALAAYLNEANSQTSEPIAT